MKSPRDCALESEQHPQLPPGADERVSGYGVMGQPFTSSHVLGLRRWTASSVGDQFTSIWHREPDGIWHFYESAQPQFACSRWFGHGVQESTVVDIDVTWDAPNVLRVISPQVLEWTLTLDSSPMTRIMSGVGQHAAAARLAFVSDAQGDGCCCIGDAGHREGQHDGTDSQWPAVRRQSAANLAGRGCEREDQRSGHRAASAVARAGPPW